MKAIRPHIVTWHITCVVTLMVFGGSCRKALSQDLENVIRTYQAYELEDALIHITEKTGIGLIYDPLLVRGKTTTCLLDEGTVEEILACIVQGTGIQYRKLDSGTYVLEGQNADDDGQESIRRILINGHVVDAETNEPLPGTNVFLSNTSMGAAAGTDGYFEFVASFMREEYTLVASMVGYEVAERSVETLSVADEEMNFSLVPKMLELSGIEVTSSAREWRRYLERFKELIFSTTDNGRDCWLVNPEALNLAFDESQRTLHAVVEKPLMMENGALGYRMILHDVVLGGEEGRLHYSGALQFENLEPKNERQRRAFQRNRREAYLGSLRHFLSALIENRVKEEDFRVYHVDMPGQFFNRTPAKREDLIAAGEDTRAGDGVLLYFEKTLLVLYLGENMPRSYRRVDRYRMSSWGEQWFQKETGVFRTQEEFQASWLTLGMNQIYIDKWGNAYTDGMLIRAGYWAWERMGEALPYDYVPEE